MDELCEITSSKRIFAADYVSEGVPFYRGREITEKYKGNLDVSTELFITEEKFGEIERKFGAPKTGDLLLTSVGTLGSVYVVKPGDRFYFKDGNLTWFRNFQELDSRFLYYWLGSPQGKAELQKATIGSSQSAFTIVLLKGMEMEIPPLPVQQRIAGILSAYDELMENSQRRIQILETMARALYREWFVQFKFPGHEKIKIIDGVPEGWEVKTLGQIAENFDRMRKPISKMKRADMQGEYPYYGAAKVFDYINDFIFDGEYLLMGEDGSVITTERIPVLQLVNEKFWPNNHTHVLRGKSPFSTHFLYLGLADVDISPYITGAAQPKITQENMNRISFFCGPENVHQEFNELVKPMIRKIQILQRQIQNLRRTRDLLLPRLLSGQVEITTERDN
jgi:type I restriction enzyme S subunit